MEFDLETFLMSLSPTSWLILSISFLVVTELVYLTFIRTERVKRRQSLLQFTIIHKFSSAMFALVLYGIPLILLDVWKDLLVLIGVCGVIALYIYLNYLAAKLFAKQESKQEEKERLDKEDEKYNFKFRPDDKVKIVSRNYSNSGQMDFKLGQIATIDRRYGSLTGDNSYRLVGSSAHWKECRFKKVGK